STGYRLHHLWIAVSLRRLNSERAGNHQIDVHILEGRSCFAFGKDRAGADKGRSYAGVQIVITVLAGDWRAPAADIGIAHRPARISHEEEIRTARRVIEMIVVRHFPALVDMDVLVKILEAFIGHLKRVA